MVSGKACAVVQQSIHAAFYSNKTVNQHNRVVCAMNVWFFFRARREKKNEKKALRTGIRRIAKSGEKKEKEKRK